MTCPSFSDRDAALREQMAGRRMGEPKDEGPFWQRQRDMALGRIETPEPPSYGIPIVPITVFFGVVGLVGFALSL